MTEEQAISAVLQEPHAEAIYRVAFKLTAISDLYGPERAIEWARSLLDDPDLLRAFARPGAAPTPEPASRFRSAPMTRARGVG